MNSKSNFYIYKILFGIALLGTILFFCFGMSRLPAAHAQEAGTQTTTQSAVPTEPTVTPTGAPQANDYYAVNSLSLLDGTSIEELIIKGPPVPPPGFEMERQTVSLQGALSSASINTLTVPAFSWVYGCSAVSAAMIAGFYDSTGYPNMYTGPTNGGVMPLNNSSWSTWSDGIYTYRNNPLVASKNGLDGRTTRGSIDDYWVQYASAADDPYITGGWTQHTWGDAIGDYMHTSQSHFNGSTTWGLDDAYTRFYDIYPASALPLTCATIESYTKSPNFYPPDGTLGRKQFYEARGYTVTDCYNQYTDNIYTGGFSFAQYKAEIDAGRPVMLNLSGHTIVGVGYDSSTNTVYLHDTWDYLNHTMTWGGSYAGMQLQAVSIVDLAPAPNSFTLSVAAAGNGGGTVTSSPTGINCGSACYYNFNYNMAVILTAVPSTGSTFTGWSGGGCSGRGTCTLTMSSARSVSATFALPDLTITNLSLLSLAPSTNKDTYLSVDVANLGAGDSTTFRIDFYIDGQWDRCWGVGQYFKRAVGLAGNTSASWTVTFPAGSLSTGTHTIRAYVDSGCEVVETNEANNNAGPVSMMVSLPHTLDDYDGDGKTDPAKFYSTTGTVWWLKSTTGLWDSTWLGSDAFTYVGASDFDGDGKTDPAKFYPATGTVWWVKSSTGTLTGQWLGADTFTYITGSDFDGDGRSDPAKFYPATGTVWWVKSTTGNLEGQWLGGDAFQFVSGSDFDGDGKTDPAKFYPATGTVWWVKSTTHTIDGMWLGPDTFTYVPASDFDGDGRTDPAKFYPASGNVWWVKSSTGTMDGAWLGPGTFTYVAGCDFDGDGKTDPTKYDSSTHILSWLNSSTGLWSSVDLGTGTYTLALGK